MTLDSHGKTPIALFTYNRPLHAKTTLETLAGCARLQECDLTIYCDGPKTPEEAGAVEGSRQVAREWAARLGAQVVEQAENRGLARSIVAGVTDLCDRYGRVIVIEDDLALSPDFLDYMLQALDRYQDMSSVYQVSGYMFPVAHPPAPDAFFMPLTTTWGWATWDRAWRIFDWNAAGAREALADPHVRRRFDLDGSYPYSAIMEERLTGRNSSWGILWWWAVFQAGGLVLHPRRSLVWNGGFDGSGTHCGDIVDAAQWDRDRVLRERFPQPLALPERAVADMAAYKRVTEFLRIYQNQLRPPRKTDLRQRIGRPVRRMLRRLWPT